MIINQTLIHTAIDLAKELFSQQTREDLAAIVAHAGDAYDEGKLIAEIAVKLVLRLGRVSTDPVLSRSASPVDELVAKIYTAYLDRYGA